MKQNYKFFQNNKCEYFPCHKTNNFKTFNCLFCFCPLYTYKDCGGNYTTLPKGVKDCSKCLLPHSNYDYVVNKLKEVNSMKIQIKYFDKEIDKIKAIDKGDWIDLRAAETIELKAGEFKLIPLGIGMKLPEGYEAHIVPRSSTFKNFGIIQTNHTGIIDNSYSGDNDQWLFPAYALRDTVIHKNDRICQFRIIEKMKNVEFEEVDKLDDVSRGGFGSTGKV